MNCFDGIKILKEDAKAIIQVLQKGMIEISDRIEVANLKTMGASERTQERLFEAEEKIRMEFDESKRLYEVLKEAIENENRQIKNPGDPESRLGVGSQ